MDSLFGVSTTQLAHVLVALSAFVLLALGLIGLRRRTLLKLGLRNAARRPLRSLVIVIGLMLSTVVISTAFATGDAMTLTIRSLVTGSVGRVDEVVSGSQVDFTQVSSRDLGNLATGGGLPQAAGGYFPLARFQTLQDGTQNSRAIAGMMPAIV